MNIELIKAILNIIPIIGFFGLYSYSNLITATAGLIILSAIALIIEVFLLKQKPTKLQIVSFAVLVVFGSSTLLFKDPSYIKLKPTFIYSILGCVFLYGMFANKGFSTQLMAKISKQSYRKNPRLDLCFAASFFLCALLNELVWRNYSEEFWVKFKVFLLPLVVAALLGMSFFLGTKSKKLSSKQIIKDD